MIVDKTYSFNIMGGGWGVSSSGGLDYQRLT